MAWDGLRLAITLLTVIPVRSGEVSAAGSGGPPGRREAGAAMCWAPVVGLGLGAIAAGLLLAVRHPLGPLTAAALAIAALAALTRGLHLDGLADLADGLGSGRPAGQALEIMRKSDIGPFGVVTLVLTLLIQVAALAHAAGTSSDWRAASTVVAGAVTGRLAIVWACVPGVPPARSTGLGALVAGSVRPAFAAGLSAAALAASVGIAAAGLVGWMLPVAVAAGLTGGLLLRRHAVRRLGGITGDVLGALSEVTTTVVILVAAGT